MGYTNSLIQLTVPLDRSVVIVFIDLRTTLGLLPVQVWIFLVTLTRKRNLLKF